MKFNVFHYLKLFDEVVDINHPRGVFLANAYDLQCNYSLRQCGFQTLSCIMTMLPPGGIFMVMFFLTLQVVGIPWQRFAKFCWGFTELWDLETHTLYFAFLLFFQLAILLLFILLKQYCCLITAAQTYSIEFRHCE